MTATNKIYQVIPKIMAEVGAVGKDHKNTMQNYQYRAIDDVMAALQPLMAKHGCFVYPTVDTLAVDQVSVGQKGTQMFHVVSQIKFHFSADDGSEFVASAIGEATDSADKAGNKAMASALKYALTQTLMIPTSDPKDSELDHPELAPAKKPPAKKPSPNMAEFHAAVDALCARDLNHWACSDVEYTEIGAQAKKLSGKRSMAELIQWLADSAMLTQKQLGDGSVGRITVETKDAKEAAA